MAHLNCVVRPEIGHLKLILLFEVKLVLQDFYKQLVLVIQSRLMEMFHLNCVAELHNDGEPILQTDPYDNIFGSFPDCHPNNSSCKYSKKNFKKFKNSFMKKFTKKFINLFMINFTKTFKNLFMKKFTKKFINLFMQNFTKKFKNCS